MNSDLDQSLQQLKAIVASERVKQSGSPLSAEERKLIEVADGRRLVRVSREVQPIVESFLTVAPSGITR